MVNNILKYTVFGKFSIVLLLLQFSCATIQEAEEQQAVRAVPKNPSVVSQLDSAGTSRIKSAIQSTPSSILSNSIEYRSGVWSIGISQTEADSLKISKELYDKYVSIVEELNSDSIK